LVDAPAAGGTWQAHRPGDLPGEHVRGREYARIVLAAGRHRPDHVAAVLVGPRLGGEEARALGDLGAEVRVLGAEQNIVHHRRSDRADLDAYPGRALGRGRGELQPLEVRGTSRVVAVQHLAVGPGPMQARPG